MQRVRNAPAISVRNAHNVFKHIVKNDIGTHIFDAPSAINKERTYWKASEKRNVVKKGKYK